MECSAGWEEWSSSGGSTSAGSRSSAPEEWERIGTAAKEPYWTAALHRPKQPGVKPRPHFCDRRNWDCRNLRRSAAGVPPNCRNIYHLHFQSWVTLHGILGRHLRPEVEGSPSGLGWMVERVAQQKRSAV